MKKKFKSTDLSTTYADANWVWKCPRSASDAILECCIVNSLNHRNIIKFEEIRWEGSAASIKMRRHKTAAEFGDCIKTSEDVKRAVLAVITSMEYLHARGIIHTDIKMQNYVYDEELVLIDFNSATFVHNSSWPRLVQTVGYRAPEVVLNNGTIKYTPSIDVWGAGCVMFQLITGEKLISTGHDFFEDTTKYLCKLVLGRIPETREERLLELEKKYQIFLDFIKTKIAMLRPDLECLAALVSDCLRLYPNERPTSRELCVRMGAPTCGHIKTFIIDGFFDDLTITNEISRDVLRFLNRNTLIYAQHLLGFVAERYLGNHSSYNLIDVTLYIASIFMNRDHYNFVAEMDKKVGSGYRSAGIAFLVLVNYKIPLP